ncbi:MAG: dihydroorotate dehydrogenase-like protein [Verrucomicrobia bacterium]|nr:dihydroorotate dehydrogenase-like protein [Verrucomicrobiota bacterium]
MDLRTTYMGMELKNPLVASASPLSEKVETIKRLEDAGAAAVVMFSLFEEQLRHDDQALDHFMSYGTDSFAESLSFFPEVDEFAVGADRYLDIIRTAKEQVDIPIIGSLNGISPKGWTEYAKNMQEAGASAIELNIYYLPTDMDLNGAHVEEQYIDVLKAVKSAVSVPVAVKISPFFSSIANMARQLDDAGADALVLFNRFYQPDFDLENLEVESSLTLSTATEIRLPLMWIAFLYGKLKGSIAATRGVQTATEVVKYILAGADVVMTTSALLKQGPDYIGTLLKETTTWMEKKEYESVSQMRGAMSQQSVADPTAFERANYIRILENYKSAFLAP